MLKRLIILTLMAAFICTLHAEKIKVRLFSTFTIESVSIAFDLGEYNLYGTDNQLIESNLGEGTVVEIKATGSQVNVSIDGYDRGPHKEVYFEAQDTACILCINPPNTKQRTYEGDLHIKVLRNESLQLINHVEFETYIAGVVQSEIYGKQTDIFRVQAIISRTWAMRNMNKHQADGYNFCDHVHCQAYHNRCIRPDIMLGAIASSGQTIVDTTGNLIETPFHSNSGGQTANSEDVWRNAVPYLRSVQDTFSYHMKQSDWTKTIDKTQWLNYFATKHKIDIQDSANLSELLSFTQNERKAKIVGVPLTRIRVDWKLRSTFFTVVEDSIDNNIILYGHGYGHGVGLSQEGTIRMVEMGISYDSIIRHYYTGAQIHHDTTAPRSYVENYIKEITQIIEDDKNSETQVKSKKDDWLGRLFRIRDREEREEVYNESEEDNETDWEYDW